LFHLLLYPPSLLFLSEHSTILALSPISSLRTMFLLLYCMYRDDWLRYLYLSDSNVTSSTRLKVVGFPCNERLQSMFLVHRRNLRCFLHRIGRISQGVTSPLSRGSSFEHLHPLFITSAEFISLSIVSPQTLQ